MFKRKVSVPPFTVSELESHLAKTIADLASEAEAQGPDCIPSLEFASIVEAKPQSLDDDIQNIGFATLLNNWPAAPTPPRMPSSRSESEEAMRYAHDDVADAEAAVVRAKERLDRLISHHNSLPRE